MRGWAWNTLALAIVLLGLPSGCGGGSANRLTVYAASSLTDVFQELEPEAEYNFGGSGELATQIAEGAEFDLFASAASEPVAELRRARIVEAPFVFATNRIVLAVARGSTIDSLDEAAAPGVKLVIAGDGVPAGDYAREALRRARAQRVLENVVSEERDVRSVLGKVALGEADAGFVYATDVAAAGSDLRAVELPPRAQVVARYYAVLPRGNDRARDLLRRLAGDEGRRVLRAHGFGVP